MRLFVDGGGPRSSAARVRSVQRALIPALISALALASCATGHTAGSPGPSAAGLAANGPGNDYPVVIGEPYEAAGILHTPADVLNYDQVGFVTSDGAGGDTVSGSHHTLPLPSYVEVTSLETGRTIVIRLERRGPMDSQDLIALSPGALAQLGGPAGTPVRVRRVNPPEDQRALLRTGQAAMPRMDTPMSLVEILRRRLPSVTPALARPALPPVPPAPARAVPSSGPLAVGAPQPVPPSEPADDTAPLPVLAAPAAVPASRPAPARAPVAATPAREGRFLVQVAAFSTAERAERAARALGGQVMKAGAYHRVRTGPFPDRQAAEASLAKVRAAGYSDARILTSG